MPVVSYPRLWWMLAAYMAAARLLFFECGLTVDVAGSELKLIAMSLVAMAWFAPRLQGRWSGRVADAAACWGVMTILSVTGALISYAVAAGTHGWSDVSLAAMDEAIGFDWTSAYRFVAARPRLNWLLGLCYLSIFVSPLLVIASLTMSGRGNAARSFLFVFGMALAITLILYRFFPARSALAYHLGTNVAFMPTTGIGHIDTIERLRAGTLTMVNLGELLGMITFPSFHAISAVLFIWAGWGVRWLRLPLTGINLGMLVATPVQGTHYLVDVIAGMAVATLSIAMLYFPGAAWWRKLRMPGAAPALTSA